MELELDAIISGCRQAYDVYQQLASRTDESLYQALGHVHQLKYQMRTDTRLDAAFGELLQQNVANKPINESLFLVKYAFFPDHEAGMKSAPRFSRRDAAL